MVATLPANAAEGFAVPANARVLEALLHARPNAHSVTPSA